MPFAFKKAKLLIGYGYSTATYRIFNFLKDALIVAFYEPQHDEHVTTLLGQLKMIEKLHNCFLKLDRGNIYTDNKLYFI